MQIEWDILKTTWILLFLSKFNKSHLKGIILYYADSRLSGVIQRQAFITSCLDHCIIFLTGHAIPLLKTLPWLSSAFKIKSKLFTCLH